MSVLNQSGEEQVECPLCMEPLEVDDLNFFPCTCGYQICRFCWHRIRTDENGLCPACRKAYSEDPADFIPLSREEVARLKAVKRHREQQRKAKLSESRKHLASVRVVQRNLVFVVGLPVRLADPELLKKHEYFGKFGKIHKVVINQSTSYAGSQGPSASAYVTYMKSDDALRAIQSVNNIVIDGRPIKSSLGTTKYCSHFMKNQPCPKPDCMYLHDFGDPEASFTKEQMHAGKHQEYEKKLHEALLSRQNTTPPPQQTATTSTSSASAGAATPPEAKNPQGNGKKEASPAAAGNANGSKETWPQLNSEKGEKTEKKPEATKEKTKGKSRSKNSSSSSGSSSTNNSEKKEKTKNCDSAPCQPSTQNNTKNPSEIIKSDKPATSPCKKEAPTEGGGGDCGATTASTITPILPTVNDNSSFFSQGFHKISPEQQSEDDASDTTTDTTNSGVLSDTFPIINPNEDWVAAFGFNRHSDHLEELATQRNHVKDKLESFGCMQQTFGKNDGVFNGLYDVNKLQENILDALTSKNNGFGHFGLSKEQTNGVNGINGLDQQMSKFFMDFHKNGQSPYNGVLNLNGFSQQQNGFYSGQQLQQQEANRIRLLQQKHLEEQLMNLNVKQQNAGGFPNNTYRNGYVNGEINGGYTSGTNGSQQLFGQQPKQNTRQQAEDELDFDPFQETQKALAELMATEQNVKSQNQGRSSVTSNNQINGLVHSQSNLVHFPPPPPGFIQPNNSHMNSFGSKILPFLNMSNSQQVNSSSQNSWPNNSYNSTQIQQQKNLSTCNDWKNLDPAILSSSRHFPLANMGSGREPFFPQQPSNGGQMRPFEYANGTFSNFTQIQQNFNNYTQISLQQNVSWFSNDFSTQINSPPGFRNSQTKQQEC